MKRVIVVDDVVMTRGFYRDLLSLEDESAENSSEEGTVSRR